MIMALVWTWAVASVTMAAMMLVLVTMITSPIAIATVLVVLQDQVDTGVVTTAAMEDILKSSSQSHISFPTVGILIVALLS